MNSFIPEPNINSFFEILGNLEKDAAGQITNEVFVYAIINQDSLINMYLVSGPAFALKNVEYENEYTLLNNLKQNGIQQIYVVPNVDQSEFIKILTVLVEKLNISNATDFTDIIKPSISLESIQNSQAPVNFSYQTNILLAAENERQRRYRVKNAIINPLNNIQTKEIETYQNVYDNLYGNQSSIRVLKGVNDN